MLVQVAFSSFFQCHLTFIDNHDFPKIKKKTLSSKTNTDYITKVSFNIVVEIVIDTYNGWEHFMLIKAAWYGGVAGKWLKLQLGTNVFVCFEFMKSMSI